MLIKYKHGQGIGGLDIVLRTTMRATRHLQSFHEFCRGYLAPEYATLGQLSEKADVFSFGVVLLEVVSGRKNIDSSVMADQAYLTRWVRCYEHMWLVP